MDGLIFDIQAYSVHDGPGCRTLVFLSGCPLSCSWCSNPEGQIVRPRLMFCAQKCIHTRYRCVTACPRKAIQVDSPNNPMPKFDRALCDRCATFDCVPACFSEALRIAGRTYTVPELMRILTRDQGFWGDQGGVTFGGGEPLFQKEFILEILKNCRSNCIHTAIETSAHVETGFLLEVLRFADWLFIDLKHMDSEAHQVETGASNELILHNIEAVARADWDGRLVIRIPVVPGFNDTEENFQASGRFLKKLRPLEVNLLPFHRLGGSKYEQLGLDYKYSQVPSPSEETMLAAKRIFEAAGLQCYVDSDTPF